MITHFTINKQRYILQVSNHSFLKGGKNMTDKVIVSVDAVCKSFHQQQILNDISLSLYPGEILGLLGPSGAGKTTLVKEIIGLDLPSKGNIHVLGEPMPNLRTMEQIGYMAQSDALYQDLTARENLDFFARLYGLKGKEKKDRIETVAAFVDLSAQLDKLVINYSGGMKRRLSLSISLLNNPKLLILDEPTVGIDPLLRKSIWNTFTQLKKQGTSIIVTTHVMDEAEKCDRLGMIRNGNLIAIDTPQNLMRKCQAQTMEEAFLYYGGKTHEN